MKSILWCTIAASLLISGCGFTNEPDPGAMSPASEPHVASDLDAGAYTPPSDPIGARENDSQWDSSLMDDQASDPERTSNDCSDAFIGDGSLDDSTDAFTDAGMGGCDPAADGSMDTPQQDAVADLSVEDVSPAE